MAESLVKRIKRDAYLSDLWTAADVLRLLPTWVEDYNHVRSRKGVEMLSPVQEPATGIMHGSGPTGATPLKQNPALPLSYKGTARNKYARR